MAAHIEIDSAEQLARDLKALAGELELIPDDIITEVHSAGFAEDGRTFILMAHLSNGGTLIVSAAEGEKLRVHVEGVCQAR